MFELVPPARSLHSKLYRFSELAKLLKLLAPHTELTPALEDRYLLLRKEFFIEGIKIVGIQKFRNQSSQFQLQEPF